MNLVRWFQQAWPYNDARQALLAEYGRLKQLRLVMADIGMRGGLWSAAPRAQTIYDAGRQEGRREMALEIFRICEADPKQLFGYVPVKRGANDGGN